MPVRAPVNGHGADRRGDLVHRHDELHARGIDSAVRVPPLSITVTVMVAVPKLFAAGVKVNVPVEFGLV